MARGDILIVNIPQTSGVKGHEQTGQRPAVVVQSDGTSPSITTSLIIPFTSNLGALRFPNTFLVGPSVTNGLNSPSVLLVFQLRAIDKRRLGNPIGQLESQYVQQLENELKTLLGLSDD